MCHRRASHPSSDGWLPVRMRAFPPAQTQPGSAAPGVCACTRDPPQPALGRWGHPAAQFGRSAASASGSARPRQQGGVPDLELIPAAHSASFAVHSMPGKEPPSRLRGTGPITPITQGLLDPVAIPAASIGNGGSSAALQPVSGAPGGMVDRVAPGKPGGAHPTGHHHQPRMAPSRVRPDRSRFWPPPAALMALGAALITALAAPFPAQGFEIYCEAARGNTLSCRRLDNGSDAIVCVDSPSGVRSCTTAEGQQRTCIRSRGNVYSCDADEQGLDNPTQCQFTGDGTWDCRPPAARSQDLLPDMQGTTVIDNPQGPAFGGDPATAIPSTGELDLFNGDADDRDDLRNDTTRPPTTLDASPPQEVGPEPAPTVDPNPESDDPEVDQLESF